eukprot:XP_001706374.1 Hypothetical protein GL50803_25128 [Giardia lamblia ATCC 50803]
MPGSDIPQMEEPAANLPFLMHGPEKRLLLPIRAMVAMYEDRR